MAKGIYAGRSSIAPLPELGLLKFNGLTVEVVTVDDWDWNQNNGSGGTSGSWKCKEDRLCSSSLKIDAFPESSVEIDFQLLHFVTDVTDLGL